MKKLLLICLILLGILANINADTPSNSFMNLPVSAVHPIEGTEWVMNNPETLDVTVSEFIKFGLNPKAIFSWEKLEKDQYVLNMLITDRMTGKRTNIKMLFMRKNFPIRGYSPPPERVLISRFIYNNNEFTPGQVFKFVLDTCNTIMVQHKTKRINKYEQGLPESMTQYWQGGTDSRTVDSSSTDKKTLTQNESEGKQTCIKAMKKAWEEINKKGGAPINAGFIRMEAMAVDYDKCAKFKYTDGKGINELFDAVLKIEKEQGIYFD